MSSFFVEQNLFLNSNKLKEKLNWIPSWGTKKSIEKTAELYKKFYADPKQATHISLSNLNE
ncbi:MAG: hypothetical protein ACJ0BR_01430 [Candidatus Puniceispirillales bacterium]